MEANASSWSDIRERYARVARNTAFGCLICGLYPVLVLTSSAECHDWARDQAVVQELAAAMIHRGLLPLHAGEHHLGHTYPSPLLYYFYTITYILTGLSDLSGLYASVVFNGLGLFVLWRLALSSGANGPAAITVLLMIIINAPFQSLARFFWPVALTPPLVLVALYAIVRIGRGRLMYYSLLTFASLAYEQIHASGLLFLITAHAIGVTVALRAFLALTPDERPNARDIRNAAAATTAVLLSMHVPQLIYATQNGFDLIGQYYGHILFGGAAASHTDGLTEVAKPHGLRAAALFIWTTFLDFFGAKGAQTAVGVLLAIGLVETARRSVRYMRKGLATDVLPFATLSVLVIQLPALALLRSPLDAYYLYALFALPFTMVLFAILMPLDPTGPLRRLHSSPKGPAAATILIGITALALLVGGNYRRISRFAFEGRCPAANYFLRFQDTAKVLLRDSGERPFDYGVFARDYPRQTENLRFLRIHDRSGTVYEASDFADYRMSEISALLRLRNRWESPDPHVFYCIVFRGFLSANNDTGEQKLIGRGFRLVQELERHQVAVYRNDLTTEKKPARSDEATRPERTRKQTPPFGCLPDAIGNSPQTVRLKERPDAR